jgi:hypothetical protein
LRNAGRRYAHPFRKEFRHGDQTKRRAAGATTAMSHIAIQEKLDGKNVDWMEKVSDEQFGG